MFSEPNLTKKEVKLNVLGRFHCPRLLSVPNLMSVPLYVPDPIKLFFTSSPSASDIQIQATQLEKIQEEGSSSVQSPSGLKKFQLSTLNAFLK